MILTDATDAAAVYLDDLAANPDNPRETLGSLTELANSIVEVGLLQPLLVVATRTMSIDEAEAAGGDHRYLVVDGHRRLAAMQSVDYDRPIPVVVTDMDRTARLVAAVSAGAYTIRLKPIERARAYKQLRDELGLTQEQIAKRCGTRAPQVNADLRLLELDEATLHQVETGQMSAQAGLKLVRATVPRPQGRKPKPVAPPDPNRHNVDITLCLTVAPSTEDARLARDVAAWFEAQHQAGHVPHSAHILSIDDWRASA